MKKTILIIAAAMVLLSACSSYTCPTYSKKDNSKPGVVRTSRI